MEFKSNLSPIQGHSSQLLLQTRPIDITVAIFQLAHKNKGIPNEISILVRLELFSQNRYLTSHELAFIWEAIVE